jgi:hypothetical protein
MSDKEIKENKDIKSDAINDDDVMISTSISDLEKMLESVEEHADKRTDSKFERFFMPSLIVFGLLAFGGFLIIYSITQDMTKLAQSMDPNMGKNMSSMVRSIDLQIWSLCACLRALPHFPAFSPSQKYWC